MKIDIYKSTKNSYKFLSVPAGTDVKALDFPRDIDLELLSLIPFKSSLELDPKRPRLALDEEDIKNQIDDKCYVIHSASVSSEISN